MTKDEMLREVAGCGVSYDALDYVEVQIPKAVWAYLQAFRRRTAEPAASLCHICEEPSTTLVLVCDECASEIL